ncbi:MAG: hypothetical protein AD073_000145 [Mycoplasmataceae bacterium]|nr:MAG: hypothetical protein AD073_000145 [Mycoplasmataceae bacterium]
MSNEGIKLFQKILSRKNIKSIINKKIKKNQKFSSEDSFFYEISPLLITLIYLISKKIIKKIFFYIRASGKNEFLICPIRGETKTKIYDESGNFTEEYHRINLINAFLKIGFPKESINLNRKIHIGHKGKNHIIPDLVISRKNKKCFVVVEVKKNSNSINSALSHQLNPAIKLLDSEYGMYYDGTENSMFFSNKGEKFDGFNFLKIPDWLIKEWKK